MQANPNTVAIFAPTILMLILIKRPIENTACQIYMWTLPAKKFPPESDSRR